MATNLHALIRYRTIDRCLRDRENIYKWQDLAEKCFEEIKKTAKKSELEKIKKPSRRSIMYDIENMRTNDALGYYAPIENSRSEGYYYSDGKYTINDKSLQKQDIDEIEYSLNILKQFSEKRNLNVMGETITKLTHTLNLKQRKIKRDIISFDHGLNEKGQRWLDNIYEHIKNKEAITLHYQPFDHEKPFYKTISPYLLKDYNKRWFLFAWDHDREKIHNHGLDRILDIRKSLKPYYEDPTFDSNLYFEDIIGVTIPKGAKKIKVVFDAIPEQAKYIKTKPFHKNLKVIKESDKKTTFSIEIIPNFEFERLLLGYGERIEIKKPISFRKKIASRVTALSSRYK